MLVDVEIEMAGKVAAVELFLNERRHSWQLGFDDSGECLIGKHGVLCSFGHAKITHFSPSIEVELDSDLHIEAEEILAR